MAYRSIKRVLGETNLELKLLFLFFVGLVLVIAGSFWIYGSRTEKLVREQNRSTGRLLVDHAMLTTHWRGMELRDAKRDPQKEGVSSYTDSLSLKNLSKEQYEHKFIRPDATEGPKAPQDDFERQMRDEFLKAGPEQSPDFRDRSLPEANQYQYYKAIYADKSCLLVCHLPPPGGSGYDQNGAGASLSGMPPAHEGDLIAIAKVTIPDGPMQHKLFVNRVVLWTTALFTGFVATVISYLIVRYVIVKPLRHLRDVSDAISRGNLALRAEIHTGDEFEELALAFNRMLRHLVTTQEELRQANVNLDVKVDELAQMNMRLYEMNLVKSDFLATMSHELRTPLNSILGFSEVLGSINALDDRQKRYVQNIQKSGRTLLDMINDILDLAKMESGKMDIRLTDFRVDPVIAAQCDMARPLSEKKNIDLEASLQGDLPPMRQDQARVQQILNNLLSNAIKFTPEGGRITVSVFRDDEDNLVMRVADTGVGIAEEDQQVIFEKFRQGRVGAPSGDAMTREYSGSGLGLSIVKELCKLLHGSVAVQSELGKGSVFTVRLPWALSEPPRPEDMGSEQWVAESGTK
ncbi:MAG: ATP-binding protein [Thermoguttaceae bacterium]|jgi:signal transduction histidine kinase